MEANILQAKDLRPYNLIKVKGDAKDYYQVMAIDALNEKVYFNSPIDNWHDISKLKPIPLSEDILLKLGFEKKSWKSQGIVIECFYYEKKGVIIYLLSKGFEVEVKHGEDQFNMFRLWNYVHQLQNIYFLLNNEELTIKE